MSKNFILLYESLHVHKTSHETVNTEIATKTIPKVNIKISIEY